MTSGYGSLVSFVSRVRSKSIVHNIYTGKIINFHSKPTPVHVPVHKYRLDNSYSRSLFIRLQQAVSKKLICRLSHKVSYDSKIIDPVNNGFIPYD